MKISVVLLMLLSSICASTASPISKVKTKNADQQAVQGVVKEVRYRYLLCVFYTKNITALIRSRELGTSDGDSEIESVENDRPPFQLISPEVIQGRINVQIVDGDAPALRIWTKITKKLYWGKIDGKNLWMTPLGIHLSPVQELSNNTEFIDFPRVATIYSAYYLGDEFPICDNYRVKLKPKPKSVVQSRAPSTTTEENDATTVPEYVTSVTENFEFAETSDFVSEGPSTTTEQSDTTTAFEDAENVTDNPSEAPLTTTDHSAAVNVFGDVESGVGKSRVRRWFLTKKQHNDILGSAVDLFINTTGIMEIIPPEVIAKVASNPSVMKALFPKPAEYPQSDVHKDNGFSSIPSESADQTAGRYFVINASVSLPPLMDMLTMKPDAYPQFRWTNEFKTFENNNRKRKFISSNAEQLQKVNVPEFKISTVTKRPGIFKNFVKPQTQIIEQPGSMPPLGRVESVNDPTVRYFKLASRPLPDAEHDAIKVLIPTIETSSTMDPLIETMLKRLKRSALFQQNKPITAESPLSASAPTKASNDDQTSEPPTSAGPYQTSEPPTTAGPDGN